MKLQKFFISVAALALISGAVVSSGQFGLNWKFLEKYLSIKLPQFSTSKTITLPEDEKVKVVTEESVVIDVVDKVSPAVVTIGITQNRRIGDILEFNPFDPFSPFQRRPGKTQKFEQDIGSGFIVGSDGLIVTNKHVVEMTDATYRVITKDDKTYEIKKIYRDPSNDLAILKIDPSPSADGSGRELPTVELGDSDKIKVGQMAIAIGTALGEFRHTVTTGVISGVGRGIDAGSPFEGSAERLDNVIQTDAAINPGNSGGPLLNSAGQVVGVNTAVSAQGQNIGFALPINVVKEALANFNATGQFNRPFLGVQYRMIPRQTAILNEIPEGAYVQEVVKGGPADKAGLKAEDVITKIDGTKLDDKNDLAKSISKKKVGDSVKLTVWRDEKEKDITVTLGNQGE
ncbi:MAG: trypsin-like peptidase domain-containing protein [Candidatus Gottesmanbacteria bacterium]|nr:trypsin-like peptidase domain-containing protein [Candidatus Gottesmanbacteria bacterium]